MARLRALALVLLGAAILLVPALVNRAPFVFYDTTHYLETGQSIWGAAHVTFPGLGGADANSFAGKASAAPAAAAVPAAPDRNESLTYVGGRSPYFSVVLAPLVGWLGLWPAVVFQALAGSWLVWLAMRLALPRQSKGAAFLGLCAVLTAGSTLSYFAGFVMPDVFAGYAIVGLLLLAAPAEWLGPWERAGLAALTAFAILAHATILALAGLTILFCLFALRRSGLAWGAIARRLKWTFAAMALGLAGGPVFSLACQVLLHDKPRSPPYLMARILADGPGRLYLAEACRDPDAFAICAFRGKRMSDHNDILWSVDPVESIFQAADYDTRVRMEDEQLAFVLGAVRHAPWLAVRAATGNALAQLGTFGVAGEIGATRRSWDTMLHAALPARTAEITGSRSYQGAYPFTVTDPLQIVVFFAGLVVVLAGAGRAGLLGRRFARDKVTPRERELGAIALGIVVIIVLNAVMCGVLSGPTPRYQGRLTWLVPLCATLLLILRRVEGSPHRKPVASAPPTSH